MSALLSPRSFLSLSFFHGGETEKVAADILWQFTEHLTDELAKSDAGPALLFRRIDALEGELKGGRDQLLGATEEIVGVVTKLSSDGDEEEALNDDDVRALRRALPAGLLSSRDQMG
jgi:hypothetical protein